MVEMAMHKGFPISYYCCKPLKCPLAHSIQLKVLVASKDYCMVIVTVMHVNKMARHLEGNMGKQAYWGGLQRCGRS
jgi:hypothetical protein